MHSGRSTRCCAPWPCETDLRFHDVLDDDIEILTNADKVPKIS